MSHNNSYASSVKASDGNYYTYSDVFSETMYSGELKNCGYSCAVKCSCNKWSSSSSGMIRPISATSGYYSDNGGTVTCYKDLGCPDGYYEDKPGSQFEYTTTANGKCYKVTGCKLGYYESYDSSCASATSYSYHGTYCYSASCKSPYVTSSGKSSKFEYKSCNSARNSDYNDDLYCYKATSCSSGYYDTLYSTYASSSSSSTENGVTCFSASCKSPYTDSTGTSYTGAKNSTTGKTLTCYKKSSDTDDSCTACISNCESSYMDACDKGDSYSCDLLENCVTNTCNGKVNKTSCTTPSCRANQWTRSC